eukprot:CAMPEP_0115055246 /NCGR_PEP_ID=MMETSP0227-20121206/4546_1 /TAXON_ID=89957 /ORGANISM="Polarella glacialis, Strain CCMP 1383" /LENGTH=295 /DNA_ID=CAMNT_0002439817 /DNA_START=38 /DNA_END=925 /DNA_ORIENTATION=+
MPAALARDFRSTFTSKLPLVHYSRGVTYGWALLFLGINVAYGKTDKLVEVIVGNIGVFYLLVGTLGEVYFHRNFIADDMAVKQQRYRQSIEEIFVAVEGLVGVCGFSCAMYEIFDPLYCPYFGYFDREAYTAGWFAANVAFYLVFCDAWFYWWHYAFHAIDALWPMHYQHHQLRGPTVHVIELILEYTLAHHLVQYLMPFHLNVHRALGVFAFVFGAIFNHGGLTLDYNDHYAHHITWKGGRAKYCNYGMFFPFWDMLNGTRYNASAPPASAAKPKEKLPEKGLEKLIPNLEKDN